MKRILTVLALMAAACGPDDLDLDGVVAEDDCDDLNAAVYPGAPEICDGLDNDCNGEIDDGAGDFLTFYADGDGDRYGNADDSLQACAAPSGYVAAAGDCDDANAQVNEGMAEVCNGIDDNCDNNVDDGDAAPSTYYRDADGDRWGDSADTLDACEAPAGYVSVDGDCDDTAANVFPGEVEVCDGIDNDCDEVVDDEAVDKVLWYLDNDGDLVGAGDSLLACFAPGDDYVMVDGDCDDTNADSFPGATEICDELDNDCNSIIDDNALDRSPWYRDADGDLYGDAAVLMEACAAPAGFVADDTDCNDLEDWSYPGADEVCDDSDNDCDTAVDEEAIDVTTWYVDSDGDGAGDSDTSVDACDAPTGYVANDLDCDDDNDSKISGCFAEDGVDITTCGGTGRLGPSQSDCDTEYAGTDMDGLVTVTSGIQSFEIPESGTYAITATGAQGASPTSSYVGGRGAEIYGEFTFSKGDTLDIIVGQAGSRTSASTGSGGGGGATWIEDGTGTLLLVAGGGGGTRNSASRNGCDASTTNYGTTGSRSSSTGSGGCVAKTTALGNGGATGGTSWGSGGGGYNTNGANDSTNGNGGTAFSSGGAGGSTGSCSRGADGGFGSGGSGGGCSGGGGGGGYSGGDGGFIAGGGGSYNTGSSPTATAGVQTGDGTVYIERL